MGQSGETRRHSRFAFFLASFALYPLLSGCGGSSSKNDPFTVEGTVVSFSEASLPTPGVVTLADLHTVGAGVPVHALDYGDELVYQNPTSYANGTNFPTTDSSGRFSIRIDRRVKVFGSTSPYGPVQEAFYYVPDRCSTTTVGSVPDNSTYGEADIAYSLHQPQGLLAAAGVLAQGHFGGGPVIVVSSDADTCANAVVDSQ